MKTSSKISLLVLSLALSTSALVAQSTPPASTGTTPAPAQVNNNLNINLDNFYKEGSCSKIYSVSLSQGGLIVVSYHKNIAPEIDNDNSNPEVLSQSSSSCKSGVKFLNYQPLEVGTAVLTFTLNDPESPVPSPNTITLTINVTE